MRQVKRQRKERSDKGQRRVTEERPDDITFSFKMNPGDDDERRVIEILVSGRGRTGGIRALIRNAILFYVDEQMPVSSDLQALGLDELADTFQDRLAQMEEIIQRLSELGIQAAPGKKSGKTPKSDISLSYLDNLKRALRGEEE